MLNGDAAICAIAMVVEFDPEVRCSIPCCLYTQWGWRACS
jgi:hypothetical protein